MIVELSTGHAFEKSSVKAILPIGIDFIPRSSGHRFETYHDVFCIFKILGIGFETTVNLTNDTIEFRLKTGETNDDLQRRISELKSRGELVRQEFITKLMGDK